MSFLYHLIYGDHGGVNKSQVSIFHKRKQASKFHDNKP